MVTLPLSSRGGKDSVTFASARTNAAYLARLCSPRHEGTSTSTTLAPCRTESFRTFRPSISCKPCGRGKRCGVVREARRDGLRCNPQDLWSSLVFERGPRTRSHHTLPRTLCGIGVALDRCVCVRTTSMHLGWLAKTE